jgi:citrate synthase
MTWLDMQPRHGRKLENIRADGGSSRCRTAGCIFSACMPGHTRTFFGHKRWAMSKPDQTTIKIRAYDGKAPGDAQSNLSEEQNNALELVKKTAQLQEEKNRSLELLKSIELLQESLRQEQARTAEMRKMVAGLEAQLKELAAQETNTRKVAELEARVKELSEVLSKISGIAATGKTG